MKLFVSIITSACMVAAIYGLVIGSSSDSDIVSSLCISVLAGVSIFLWGFIANEIHKEIE